MLRLALLFFIFTILAAVIGFTDLFAGAAPLGRVMFYVFLTLFIAATALGTSIFGKK